jgi:hypothetical protein
MRAGWEFFVWYVSHSASDQDQCCYRKICGVGTRDFNPREGPMVAGAPSRLGDTQKQVARGTGLMFQFLMRMTMSVSLCVCLSYPWAVVAEELGNRLFWGTDTLLDVI